MRRDRELEYRPYISWRLTELNTQAGVVVGSGRVVGANFGRGHAAYGKVGLRSIVVVVGVAALSFAVAYLKVHGRL